MTIQAESKLMDQNYTFREYSNYLRTAAWKGLRSQAFERAGCMCEVCGENYRLKTHHKRYPETLGTETVADLIVLCVTCHRNAHDPFSYYNNTAAQGTKPGFFDGTVKVYTKAEIEKYQKNLTK